MTKLKLAVSSLCLLATMSSAVAYQDISLWLITNHTNSPLCLRCSAWLPSAAAPRFEGTQKFAAYEQLRWFWYIDSDMEPARFECLVASSCDYLKDTKTPHHLAAPWRGITKIDIALVDNHTTITARPYASFP